MTFRQTVEKVLGQLYKPFHTLYSKPDPDWKRVMDWYTKRYLNPDSPMKGNK